MFWLLFYQAQKNAKSISKILPTQQRNLQYIFYGSQTRTCPCRRHAVGVIEDSAFLHSRDFSVFCDKADVGHVFASSTSVYGTELFLFVPAAGHTHWILDTLQHSFEFCSKISAYCSCGTKSGNVSSCTACQRTEDSLSFQFECTNWVQ